MKFFTVQNGENLCCSIMSIPPAKSSRLNGGFGIKQVHLSYFTVHIKVEHFFYPKSWNPLWGRLQVANPTRTWTLKHLNSIHWRLFSLTCGWPCLKAETISTGSAVESILWERAMKAIASLKKLAFRVAHLMWRPVTGLVKSNGDSDQLGLRRHCGTFNLKETTASSLQSRLLPQYSVKHVPRYTAIAKASRWICLVIYNTSTPLQTRTECQWTLFKLHQIHQLYIRLFFRPT